MAHPSAAHGFSLPQQQQTINQFSHFQANMQNQSFESLRLTDYRSGNKGRAQEVRVAAVVGAVPQIPLDQRLLQLQQEEQTLLQILQPSVPATVFGRAIVGSVAPIVFTAVQPAWSALGSGFPPAFTTVSGNGFPSFWPAQATAPFNPVAHVTAPAANPANMFRQGSASVLTAAAASRHQEFADERFAQELQQREWAQDIPSQSVPRVEAPPRDAHLHRAGAPVPAAQAITYRPTSHAIRPLVGSATAIIDLPHHVVRLIIDEAVKQQQTCSISFDNICSENACVTTCGHVFSKDSIKEWLKQNSTCPECRKPCRINGEAAAAPPPRTDSVFSNPFGFGAAPAQSLFGPPVHLLVNDEGLGPDGHQFGSNFASQARAAQPRQPSLYFGNPNELIYSNRPAGSF
jgi:hypothetical protein